MKKSSLLGLGLVLATTGLTTLSSVNVSAHGYVISPISRAYQGQLDKENIGYDFAVQKYGPIINEPQSLEAPQGFPKGGPADGKIASANDARGFELDKQTSSLWTKQNLTGERQNSLGSIRNHTQLVNGITISLNQVGTRINHFLAMNFN